MTRGVRQRATTGAEPPARNPHVQRFLLSCERLVAVWTACLGLALVLGVLGFLPSLFGVIGFLGLAWVPVLLLILWGRLLEDMGFRPPDGRDCS